VLGHCWLGNRKGIQPVKETAPIICYNGSLMVIQPNLKYSKSRKKGWWIRNGKNPEIIPSGVSQNRPL